MKTIFQAFLASCLVSAVLAAKCCAPPKWEGRQYGAGRGRFRGSSYGNNEEYVRIFYDGENKKTAIAGVVVHEGNEEQFKAIFNYETKKAYVILPTQSKCRIIPQEKTFVTHCIPDNAQLEGESSLGAGDQTLKVRTYKLTVKDDIADVIVYSVVTADDCIPVFVDVWGSYNNSKFFENYNYVGITSGISNECVFDIPSFCSETTTDLIADMIHDKYIKRMHF